MVFLLTINDMGIIYVLGYRIAYGFRKVYLIFFLSLSSIFSICRWDILSPTPWDILTRIKEHNHCLGHRLCLYYKYIKNFIKYIKLYKITVSKDKQSCFKTSGLYMSLSKLDEMIRHYKNYSRVNVRNEHLQ